MLQLIFEPALSNLKLNVSVLSAEILDETNVSIGLQGEFMSYNNLDKQLYDHFLEKHNSVVNKLKP